MLADKSQGKEFCKQFEESCNKLEEYVKNLKKEIKDRTELIEYLEQADLFYDAQYGEVKLVATVRYCSIFIFEGDHLQI